MVNRAYQTVHTGQKNSLKDRYSDPKNTLKIVKNAFLIEIGHLLQAGRLKKYLYRKAGIEIGKDVSYLAKPNPVMPEKISVGDNTIIAGESCLMTHAFLMDEYRVGEIKIGENVVVGQKSVVLPGVTIEDDAVVAAGAVVTGDVESGQKVAGNPAEPIE